MFNLELFGLSSLYAIYTIAGLLFMGLLLVAAIFTSLISENEHDMVDRALFWMFGLLLCGFATFRPVGLALDDPAYIEILYDLCPAGNCANGLPIERDHIWFGLARLGLLYFPGGLDVALTLSGFGVFIKLFVIDRLCQQRLLALLLFVPISFIQYDMTQLRAGFASAWMMLGIYWLVRSRIVLGSLIIVSNFMVHSQAIFSIGLLANRFLVLKRWIFPSCTIAFLGFIYMGVFPSYAILSELNSFGVIPKSAAYLLEGGYEGEKAFPWGYLPILGYGIWLWSSSTKELEKVSNIVATSLLLGLVIAWFFTAIPIIQTRLFDFYALPIILLAGNLGKSSFKFAATSLLAIGLYLRLELIQDWILG